MATKAATTKKTPARKAAPAKTKTTSKTAPAKAKKTGFVEYVAGALKPLATWRAFGAEALGTFLLAAAVITGQGQPIIIMFALAGIVLLVGAISGAHLNPAITIAALVTRRIEWVRAVGYIIAQVIGAALAFVVLSAFLEGAASDETSLLYAAPSLFQAVDLANAAGKEWYVLFAEITGTAILGFAVATALRAKETITAGLTVGFGIFVALIVAATAAGYVTASAIINPAVAVALQALSWEVWPLVIYILGATIGATIGFVLYDLLNGRKEK